MPHTCCLLLFSSFWWAGMSVLVPNGTYLGLFKISFRYILGRRWSGRSEQNWYYVNKSYFYKYLYVHKYIARIAFSRGKPPKNKNLTLPFPSYISVSVVWHKGYRQWYVCCFLYCLFTAPFCLLGRQKIYLCCIMLYFCLFMLYYVVFLLADLQINCQ